MYVLVLPVALLVWALYIRRTWDPALLEFAELAQKLAQRLGSERAQIKKRGIFSSGDHIELKIFIPAAEGSGPLLGADLFLSQNRRTTRNSVIYVTKMWMPNPSLFENDWDPDVANSIEFQTMFRLCGELPPRITRRWIYPHPIGNRSLDWMEEMANAMLAFAQFAAKTKPKSA